MTLELVITLLGWAMVLIPIALFLFISAYMFWGIAKDDGMIKSLVMLFLFVFTLGAGMLGIVYFTDLLATKV
jgi:hypothetical protein